MLVQAGACPKLAPEAQRLVEASHWVADLPAGAELALPETEDPFAPPMSAAVQPHTRRRLLGTIMRGLDLVRALPPWRCA